MKKVTILLPIIATILLTLIAQKTVLANDEAVKQWLASYGLWAIAAFAGVSLVTITLMPPLGGMAAAIAIWALYGPVWGTIIVYFVSNTLFCLNFYLAKRYGKKFVKRVLGKKTLDTIQKYEKYLSFKNVFFLKVGMGGSFDYLAYGIGLFDTLSLKQFVFINFIGSIPGMILFGCIFALKDITMATIISYIVGYALSAIGILILFKKNKKNIANLIDENQM